jgi:alanyl-tRNA synthetase
MLEVHSYRSLFVRDGDRIGIVSSETPFFPGGGGQVCDVGRIVGEGFEIEVDCVEEKGPGVIVHWGVGRIKGGGAET